MAEWLKARDCKSLLSGVRWFESNPAHHIKNLSGGLAQLVERLLYTQDVVSSNLAPPTICSVRLMVRTPPFHGGNTSSNLVGITTSIVYLININYS